MLSNPIISVVPDKKFSKDFIKVTFDLQLTEIPKDLPKNDKFIFENEILLVNFGEVGKFSVDYVYQSKFVVFKDNERINFGGYCPDWKRNTDILKDSYGHSSFSTKEKYHVEIVASRYRVYLNVNYGALSDTYANARDEVDAINIYVNDGVNANVTNFNVEEFDRAYDFPNSLLGKLIEEKCFSNYLSYHIDPFGVFFDRLNLIQNISAKTRNSGQYNSNVMFDIETNSKAIEVEYFIMDSEVPDYEFKFGFLVDGKSVNYKEYKKANKGDYCNDKFVLGVDDNKLHRVTLVFPCSFSVAIRAIYFDKKAVVKPIAKNRSIVFLGDSITEGSECFDPEYSYVNQLTRHFNVNGYDFAVSGTTFNEFDLLGEYSIQPDYIIIANGTNSYCMGTAIKSEVFASMEESLKCTIDKCKQYFPYSKVIALLPIWRSDENGPNFSLIETNNKLKEIYETNYPEIEIIDCYDFIPHNDKYFSNSQLALHPNTDGHELYGAKLIEVLEPIINKN